MRRITRRGFMSWRRDRPRLDVHTKPDGQRSCSGAWNALAALYKALGGFATNGVNMTKLESYMMDGEFAATQFMCDVDGHPEQPALRLALEELQFFSSKQGWGLSGGPVSGVVTVDILRSCLVVPGRSTHVRFAVA